MTTRRKDSLPAAPVDAPWMTRVEVAALLRTTPAQISNMTSRGQLVAPAKIAGLGLRWRRADLLAWMEVQP